MTAVMGDWRVKYMRDACDEIVNHAFSNVEMEMVGMVLSSGRTVRLDNQARSSSRFAISQTQLAERLAEVDPEVETVIGFYHSHPGGKRELSYTDVESMRSQWNSGVELLWAVLAIDGDSWHYSVWGFDQEMQLCQLN